MSSLIIRWSKKERDWIVDYPDRNGKIVGAAFFNMFSLFMAWKEKKDTTYILPDLSNKFSAYLKEAGYDPESMRITIKKLP